MTSIKRWHIFVLATAIVLCMTLIPLSAGAAGDEILVSKGQARASDLAVTPKRPVPADNLMIPEAPVHEKAKKITADSAIGDVAMRDEDPGPHAVNYASAVAKRTPNELILNTVISRAEKEETLRQLANKVYLDNGGPGYDTVTIFWHVSENSHPAAPWGRTDIRKGDTAFTFVRLGE